MANIKFVQEPGVIRDLFFIFILHFNRDLWNKKMTVPENAVEDIEFYNTFLGTLPAIPDELFLFFFLKDENMSFMANRYLKPKFGIFNFEYFIEQVADIPGVTKNLVSYYLYDQAQTIDLASDTFLEEISECIDASEYTDMMKHRLLAYFVNPVKYTKLLTSELIQKLELLTRYRDEHYKQLVDAQQNFDYEALAENKNKKGERLFSLDPQRPILVSFCVIHRYLIAQSDNTLLLGIDYQKSIEILNDQSIHFDLETLGKILCDKNRVLIMELLKETNELTTTEIANKLSVTVTVAMYHLNMMQNSKILLSRCEGKTVFYRLNRNYFKVASSGVLKYIESDH